MSDPERKGQQPSSEGRRSRWQRRLQRLRNEAGLYLVRGAATAAGGVVVSYGWVWIQSKA